MAPRQKDLILPGPYCFIFLHYTCVCLPIVCFLHRDISSKKAAAPSLLFTPVSSKLEHVPLGSMHAC